MNTFAARHPVTGALCAWYKLEEICNADRAWLGAQGVHARPRHYKTLENWLNAAGVPVLGAAAEMARGTRNPDNGWVVCPGCGLSTKYYADPADAAKAWNRRVSRSTTHRGGGEE